MRLILTFFLNFFFTIVPSTTKPEDADSMWDLSIQTFSPTSLNLRQKTSHSYRNTHTKSTRLNN